MDTRTKTRNTSVSPIISERLLTKKEMEECPERYMTCPSVPKKSFPQADNLRTAITMENNGNSARALYFNKSTMLSKLYDPSKNMTYLCQLYNVYDCIGEGSFGVVYKARNVENNINYAIKLMKKYNSEATNYDEIRRLEKIGEHKNIIKFYFAWKEDSRIYLQLELCALSLAVYTKSNHSINNHQLWDIFLDMLYALRHLHSRSLAHLDIKPDNIMISKDGNYKLGDFGLLIDLNERPGINNQSYHQSEGDAKYLAKEVLEGIYTCSADIFSLGISMLELSADLVLPVSGPMWHVLRDGTFSSPYYKMIPFKLSTVIVKMVVPNYRRRLDVNELLNLNAVERAITERKNRPFINYYTLYKSEHVNENHIKPIAVCVNPKESLPPESPLNNEKNNRDNLDPNMATEEEEQQRIAIDANSSCHTPPKRVSQVILYSI